VFGSDRAYEIKPSVYGYREDDPLGGVDPCSSSQAAAEVAVEAWRRAFFKNHPVRLATVRAGHTIGGGDWAETRFIPQCARAWLSGRPIRIRDPEATRFWQHVMEPLSGCLWLAARLAQSSAPVNGLADAFNFGPGPDTQRTVREVLMEARKLIGAEWVERTQRPEVRENAPIRLSVGKAAALLGWRTVWTFSDAVRETIRWYFDVAHASDSELAIRLTRDQIEAYVGRARDLGLPWACFAGEQQVITAEPEAPKDQPVPT
jgi:CDP-glucose 4,6-dehydratase